MVFIKRIDNPLGDPGDATHVGTDHWDTLDKLHDDIDIEATTGPVQLNTKWEVRNGKLYLWNGANTFKYNITSGVLGANANLELPDLSANGKLVAAGGANDWGTAIQTFRDGNIAFRNPANSLSYIWATSAIIANRTITLPLLQSNDTFVFNNHAAELITKTLHFDLNTFKHSTTNTQGDIYKYDSASGKLIRVPRGTANQLLKVNAGGTDIEWANESGSLAADKVKVYEGGTLIGTVARKLNFSATDFNVTEDAINDELDVSLAVGGGGGGNSTTLFKNTTTLSVASTSVEANLFSQSISAGIMGTNNILHVIISGWILNDSGGSDGFTFRLKLGGTTLWEDDTPTFTDHTMRRPLHMEFWIKNMNSASVQHTTGTYIIGNPANAPVGFSDLGAVAINPIGVINGADTTVATASAQTLLFSVDPSDSSANLSVNADTLLVELII